MIIFIIISIIITKPPTVIFGVGAVTTAGILVGIEALISTVVDLVV